MFEVAFCRFLCFTFAVQGDQLVCIGCTTFHTFECFKNRGLVIEHFPNIETHVYRCAQFFTLSMRESMASE